MSAAPAAVRMPETWRAWQGQVVNDEFPLREFLGGSDHSAVFLTEFGTPRQNAAIKVIPKTDLDDQHLARWERAKKLAHPNLLRVLAFGRCRLEDKALLYVVTELAEEDLAQIVPERALSAEEVKTLLPPVLDCLRYLHGQGVVHGRLKPANVMAVGNNVRLAVDGIVPFGEQPAKPSQWAIYDAPESGAAMPPADVWSLGVTLAEILTRHKPVWREDQKGDLIVADTLPQPFLEIVRNCLRRDPGRRLSLDEISVRLRPAVAKKTAAVPRGQGSTVQKHNWMIPAGATVLAVALVWGGWRAMHRSGETGQPVPAVQAGSNATAAPGAPAESAEPRVSAPKQSPPPESSKKQKAPRTSGGSVVTEIQPQVSRSALGTISGKVRVRVRVTADESGNVTDARFESEGPSQYFARQAMDAAKQWKFSGPGEWVIAFYFAQSGTETNAEAAR